MTGLRGLLGLWLALSGLTALPRISGAETIDPFEIVVSVADRSEHARQDALADALAEALVRLSGSASAATAVRGVAIDELVRQFRYRSGPADPDDPLATPPLELLVSFVPAGVRRLAVDAGLPLWPLERGSTVIWIALGDATGRRLLGVDPADESLLDAAQQRARSRGVPLIRPLLDLEDQRAVSAAEIWGGFDDRVRVASARYGATYALAGRIAEDRYGWTGRWILDLGAGVQRWEDFGESPAGVIEAAVDALAERLAREFAVLPDPDEGNGVLLIVRDVDSAARYGRVLGYLSSRSMVETVRLQEADGPRLTFRIALTGDAEALARVLALDDALVREPTRPSDPLTYRLGALAFDGP